MEGKMRSTNISVRGQFDVYVDKPRAATSLSITKMQAALTSCLLDYTPAIQSL